MVSNSYELLEYLATHASSDNICSTYRLEDVLGVSKDDLDCMLQELNSLGYIQIFIRSVKITSSGLDYLR